MHIPDAAESGGMADPAEVKTAMAKLPRGEWRLELEDDSTVELHVSEADVGDEGFYAEGRNEEAGYAYRLDERHDGAVELERRPLDGDGWEEVGTVAWADQP